MTNNIITAEELERFTITNRREIVFYLHQLINDNERLIVSFDEGREAVLTVLLEVDEENDLLIFDWGGSEASNQKLLHSERNFFSCAPHGIGNRFRTGPIRQINYKKQNAFATQLPTEYLRLQRREYFRLVLPITRRPSCLVRKEEGTLLQLTVVDISIGGIAAELPGGLLPFTADQILPKARIDLKGVGTLDVDLEVRNTSEIKRGEKVSGRIGCSFVKLSHAMENHLQKFITDVQRDERARLGS